MTRISFNMGIIGHSDLRALYHSAETLEFAIKDSSAGSHALRQTATFRPQGLLGRLYWQSVMPFHWLLFPRMARNLAMGYRMIHPQACGLHPSATAHPRKNGGQGGIEAGRKIDE